MVKTSAEIATIAALEYFGKNPEEGLVWIEAIYNAARRASTGTPVSLDIKIAQDKILVPMDIKTPAQPKKIRKSWKQKGVKPTVIPGRPKPAELNAENDTRTMDERMEAAYLGEHPNIQPEEKPVDKKPLTPAEKRLYDYMVAHPDHTKPRIQTELLMSEANYYYLKAQLKKKGWISGDGIIDYDFKPEDERTRVD